MWKRALVILLVGLSLSAIPMASSCVIEGKCDCPSSVGHYYEYPTYYYSLGESTHMLIEKQLVYCGGCNTLLTKGSDMPLTDPEAHVYRNGSCVQCGHVDSSYQSTQKSVIASTATMGVKATVRDTLIAYTGPGEEYVEAASFFYYKNTVTVRSKVWNDFSQTWWVQIEFKEFDEHTYGDTMRAYTEAWRVNVDLNQLPEEVPLRQCYVTTYSDAFSGPAYMKNTCFTLWHDSVFSNTAATLYEIDDDYAHIECWNSYKQKPWRVWIKKENIDCGYLYNYDQYYGSADDPATTTHPSTSSNSGATSSHYLVGKWCWVKASISHVKSGPGPEYGTVDYVNKYERYEILDCTIGSTGKEWYLIEIYGNRGWVSSGMMSLIPLN